MATISVVVPVYRIEEHIHRCVDSILDQTFSDFELILVDDGSPDNCGVICEDYARKDSRVHVIHQRNGGLSAARNTGIEWALPRSSQWITFIDSDDWVHPRMLEILYNMVTEYCVKVGICSRIDTFGETPEIYTEQVDTVLWETEPFYVKNTMITVTAWGKLYHKSCFSDIRYPVGKIHEDEYTTYKVLFREEHVVVTSCPLYFYFQNPKGITKSKWTTKRLDVVQAYNEQAAYFKKHKFNRAYEYAAALYAQFIIQQCTFVKEQDISEAEKEACLRWLNRCLKRAAWDYKDVYLRKEIQFYMYVFPRLYRVYRWIRGKQ